MSSASYKSSLPTSGSPIPRSSLIVSVACIVPIVPGRIPSTPPSAHEGTNAGKLFAKQVIHAPTMEQPGMKVGVENVRRATRAALLAAARLEIEVLAIPGMGTGLGGVDPADAARAMVDELRAHRQPKPATVYLVDIDDEILLCLEEALRLAVG